MKACQGGSAVTESTSEERLWEVRSGAGSRTPFFFGGSKEVPVEDRYHSRKWDTSSLCAVGIQPGWYHESLVPRTRDFLFFINKPGFL
ncbi:hypothetical protein JOE21_002535 [Desmospora profundinema]|uniref:Uncharacterized protein n=1 Tax=Desmospora profundinema TaxID=1571184 RepID=A0ABU1IP26_9BACL|nr:hypothetical protein [Desmospora profundinema]